MDNLVDTPLMSYLMQKSVFDILYLVKYTIIYTNKWVKITRLLVNISHL